MAKIEIRFHPPLSYQFTSDKVGIHRMKVPCTAEESLADLLLKLSRDNRDEWEKLFDPGKMAMKRPIRTILNGKILSPSSLNNVYPSEGDCIAFVVLYGGG